MIPLKERVSEQIKLAPTSLSTFEQIEENNNCMSTAVKQEAKLSICYSNGKQLGQVETKLDH